jgi:hypothetical protein
MPPEAHAGSAFSGRYAIEREVGRGGMATVLTRTTQAPNILLFD